MQSMMESLFLGAHTKSADTTLAELVYFILFSQHFKSLQASKAFECQELANKLKKRRIVGVVS